MKHMFAVGIESYFDKFEWTEFLTDEFVFTYNYLRKDKPIILHYHTTYELEIVVDGEVEMSIDSDKYKCLAGYCWIVCPGSIHNVYPPQNPAQVISIKFTEKSVIPEIVRELQKVSPHSVGKLDNNCIEYIKASIDLMFASLSSFKNDSAQRILITSTVSPILSAILENIKQCGNIETELASPQLLASISYIIEHFSEKLSRDEVARRFNFSPSGYSRAFNSYIGKSFSDFILDERLRFAYYLVVSTELSMTEIAENSGFESLSYFSKTFKKNYGKSPKYLRMEVNK